MSPISVVTILLDTLIVKAAGTAIMVAMRQLTTYITIYIVLNVTLNITEGVFCTRVHFIILKGTLSLFIKLDAHMRRHPLPR